MTDKEFREYLKTSNTNNRNNGYCNPDVKYKQKPPLSAELDESVNKVLLDIAPHKTTCVMARGKTKMNTLYNTFNVYGSFSGMPTKQQDIFTGIVRAPLVDGDGTRFSTSMIFMLLKTFKKFNPEELSNWLNVKRALRALPLISVPHARKLINKCESVATAWSSHNFILADATEDDFCFDLGVD